MQKRSPVGFVLVLAALLSLTAVLGYLRHTDQGFIGRQREAIRLQREHIGLLERIIEGQKESIRLLSERTDILKDTIQINERTIEAQRKTIEFRGHN